MRRAGKTVLGNGARGGLHQRSTAEARAALRENAQRNRTVFGFLRDTCPFTVLAPGLEDRAGAEEPFGSRPASVSSTGFWLPLQRLIRLPLNLNHIFVSMPIIAGSIG